MRVLVCGSRTWFPYAPILHFMYGWVNGEHDTVIHGGASGADAQAAAAGYMIGAAVEEYPADWERYGKRAGYIRNKQMLEEGRPDLVLAFVDKPLGESKGTAMMVDLAMDADIPTYVIHMMDPMWEEEEPDPEWDRQFDTREEQQGLR